MIDYSFSRVLGSYIKQKCATLAHSKHIDCFIFFLLYRFWGVASDNVPRVFTYAPIDTTKNLTISSFTTVYEILTSYQVTQYYQYFLQHIKFLIIQKLACIQLHAT